MSGASEDFQNKYADIIKEMAALQINADLDLVKGGRIHHTLRRIFDSRMAEIIRISGIEETKLRDIIGNEVEVQEGRQNPLDLVLAAVRSQSDNAEDIAAAEALAVAAFKNPILATVFGNLIGNE